MAKLKKPVLFILLGIFTALLLPFVYFNFNTIQDVASVSRPIKIGESKNFLEINDSRQKFISQKNGVSLVAGKKVANGNINIIEDENTIYLSICGEGLKDCFYKDGGQYIQMFRKPERQSLSDAIKEKFLKNYNDSDCVVTPELSLQLPDKGENKTEYIISNIDVASLETLENYDQLNEQIKKCPAQYTKNNGTSYFIMSKNHSDRFYFVRIGQYGIPAGADASIDGLWQDNLEIL